MLVLPSETRRRMGRTHRAEEIPLRLLTETAAVMIYLLVHFTSVFRRLFPQSKMHLPYPRNFKLPWIYCVSVKLLATFSPDSH